MLIITLEHSGNISLPPYRRSRSDTDMGDANCGADGWAMAPAGLHGPLNDAIAIYFNDATLAAAFVARWCAGYRAESTDGVFQIREDEPTPCISAGFHKTP